MPSTTDRTVVEQRILEQFVRVADDGAVTGWAALRLWGAAFFDGLGPDGSTRLPVPLVCERHLTDNSESIATRASTAGHKMWIAHGIRLVGPERAVVDEILRLRDLHEAVVTVDMACAARTTSIARIRSYAERFPRPGGSILASALDLANEHSRSPQETRMRLVWELDAGWPTPLCNRVVFSDAGSRLGKPDLLDLATGVVGEYDGALHRSRSRHRIDTDRAERFRRHGLEPFVVVAGDRPETQVERMNAARDRALRRDPTERRWSLTLPGGESLAEMSLDEELDLRGFETD